MDRVNATRPARRARRRVVTYSGPTTIRENPPEKEKQRCIPKGDTAGQLREQKGGEREREKREQKETRDNLPKGQVSRDTESPTLNGCIRRRLFASSVCLACAASTLSRSSVKMLLEGRRRSVGGKSLQPFRHDVVGLPNLAIGLRVKGSAHIVTNILFFIFCCESALRF